MNEKEARKIIDILGRKKNPTEDELIKFTNAMEFLIKNYNNPKDMAYFGEFYYDQRKFDLSVKYYEMAANLDYDPAISCLGYFWYYGRTGEKDYEKAFQYFSKSAKLGNLKSLCKVADMYKHGYFVKEDYNKYVEIIKELYIKVKNAEFMHLPLPEVFSRLAVIYKKEGKKRKAINLLKEAKDFLKQRIIYNSFWGDLNVMMWLIDDLYNLKKFNKKDFDLYDLFYLLTKPSTVSFKYKDKDYIVKSYLENSSTVIEFEGKKYYKREDFFEHASIDNALLTHLYFDLEMFKIIKTTQKN